MYFQIPVMVATGFCLITLFTAWARSRDEKKKGNFKESQYYANWIFISMGLWGVSVLSIYIVAFTTGKL